MKKIFIRAVVTFAVVLMFTLIFVLVKLFIIGKIMPPDRITVQNISIDNDIIRIDGGFYRDSALAYRGYKYRIEDDNLYVKVYCVLVSDIYKYGKVDIDINGQFSNLQNIYFEDQDNVLLVWTQQSHLSHLGMSH